MITKEQYEKAAELLHTDVAAIKAVERVETGGKSGFDEDGSPRILFEAHLFYAALKKKGYDVERLMQQHPNILSPKWNKALYKGGKKEWDRLNEAISINRPLALESASWGAFQILGSNYEQCGCIDVFEFIDRVFDNEFEQLMQFCIFIKNSVKLSNAIRKHDWATFARYYNGPAYAENQYDRKLEQAYKLFS